MYNKYPFFYRELNLQHLVNTRIYTFIFIILYFLPTFSQDLRIENFNFFTETVFKNLYDEKKQKNTLKIIKKRIDGEIRNKNKSDLRLHLIAMLLKYSAEKSADRELEYVKKLVSSIEFQGSMNSQSCSLLRGLFLESLSEKVPWVQAYKTNASLIEIFFKEKHTCQGEMLWLFEDVINISKAYGPFDDSFELIQLGIQSTSDPVIKSGYELSLVSLLRIINKSKEAKAKLDSIKGRIDLSLKKQVDLEEIRLDMLGKNLKKARSLIVSAKLDAKKPAEIVLLKYLEAQNLFLNKEYSLALEMIRATSKELRTLKVPSPLLFWFNHAEAITLAFMGDLPGSMSKWEFLLKNVTKNSITSIWINAQYIILLATHNEYSKAEEVYLNLLSEMKSIPFLYDKNTYLKSYLDHLKVLKNSNFNYKKMDKNIFDSSLEKMKSEQGAGEYFYILMSELYSTGKIKIFSPEVE